MRKVAYKALYLFLCSILGIILLSMLHRALFVILDLLLVGDYNPFSLGISPGIIALADFFSMLVAWFIGGWYGIVLGLDWYAIVYGPNADKPARLFHAFMPHHWRGTKKVSAKMPLTERIVERLETPIKVPVAESVSAWGFDDLLTPAAPKKRTATKRTTVAKKTTRRAATTKRTKIIS